MQRYNGSDSAWNSPFPAVKNRLGNFTLRTFHTVSYIFCANKWNKHAHPSDGRWEETLPWMQKMQNLHTCWSERISYVRGNNRTRHLKCLLFALQTQNQYCVRWEFSQSRTYIITPPKPKSSPKDDTERLFRRLVQRGVEKLFPKVVPDVDGRIKGYIFRWGGTHSTYKYVHTYTYTKYLRAGNLSCFCRKWISYCISPAGAIVLEG